MALVLQDRVSVNSTGSGTGSLVLGSAYPGFRTFASCIPTGSIVYYTITNQAVGLENQWEVGYGTYTLSTNTLSRDNVYSSSNSNSLVNFTAGTNGLQVFITYPSEQAVYQETNGDVLIPNGILTVIGSGATNPTFVGTLGEFVSNEPGFSQLLTQNQSNAANASTDVVSYNNLGDGTNYFVDTGIASSTYNDAAYPIFQANDAYLYNGGNTAGTGAAGDISRLLIGTSTANSNVVIFGGSVNVNAVIATFVASTKDVNFANGISVTGNASANNVTLTNLAYAAGNLSNAANSTVLTTRAYVDAAVATGFVVHAAVRAASTAAFAGTIYNNGTAGVGATLTADTNRQFNTLDGVSVTVGQRVLIKDMTTAAYNGVYTLTSNGSTGVSPWVLTRATDFDTVGAGEVANNAYFYVQAGTVNAGSAWVLNQLAAITIGTTSLPFDLFASSLVYVGGQNINISGQTISLTDIVPIANGGTNLSSYTTGDVIYANATNTLTRRAIGASNTVLVSNGSVPDWGTVALGSASAVSGTLGATNGGTGQAAYTLGDIIYSNATNSLARLSGQITTTQKFLSQTGTGAASAAPVWDTIPAGSITGLGTMSTQNANAVSITGGTLNNVAIGGTTANTGTFTTATATLFDGSGANLTSLNGSNVSTGTIDNARTTAASANGASTIVTRDATGNFAANTITANLTGTASSATSATSATTATNIAGGAAGGIPYQTGSGATSILATGTGVLVGGTTPSYSSAPTLTGTNFTSIPNGATTASAANGASTIVARDATGNFTANAITTTSISGSGASLTSLNASNLASGTIPSAILGNSTVYVGTTAVALNRASANLALTGILSETYSGATSGTIQVIPAAVAGTGTVITLPATTGTVVTTGDTGSVTNTMLAGSIANAKLANSSTTINGTAIALGASGTITATATNALTIGTGLSGTSYNGSAAVTVALANTAVAAGSYTYASITVDAQGRLTTASSGASPSAFPAGTVMLFAQTSAPTGWTKNTTTGDNSALRVTTGAASTGGTVAFTTAFASQSVAGSISNTTATNQAFTPAGSVSVTSVVGSAGATTLSTPQIPSHSHSIQTYCCNGAGVREGGNVANNTPNTGGAGGSGSHSHPFSFSSGSGSFTGTSATVIQNAHNHTFTGTAINLAVQYIDVIRATKD